MPRSEDEFDDDDRPRRRPRDEDEDRPRRRYEDDDDRGPPKKKSSTGLIVGILVGIFVVCCGGGGAVAYLLVQRAKKGVEEFAGAVQEAAETGQSQQNLMAIGKAAHDYHDAMGALPNNSYDAPGGKVRPLLSWRVHLLPYLGENALYKQFKLDEPWDSANNIRLLNQIPAVYGGPGVQKKAGVGKTFYRGFSAPRGIFEKATVNNPKPAIKFASITDGTSSTILVIDAGEAVEWTKPDDLDFSPGKPRPALGGAYPTLPYTLVLMCDGTVHQLRKDVSDETLRMLIDRADGSVLPPGWDR